jgi:hypothetical protein
VISPVAKGRYSGIRFSYPRQVGQLRGDGGCSWILSARITGAGVGDFGESAAVFCKTAASASGRGFWKHLRHQSSSSTSQHWGESIDPVDLSLQTGAVGFFDPDSILLFGLTP